jgi:hypothetical protein
MEEPVPHAIVISYDDPDCGGAADAMADMIQRIVQERRYPTIANLVLKSLPVEGSNHTDVVANAVSELKAAGSTSAGVVCLMRDMGAEEYRRLEAFLTRGPTRIDGVFIKPFVLTQLSNYQDVGLLLKTVLRNIFSTLAAMD